MDMEGLDMGDLGDLDISDDDLVSEEEGEEGEGGKEDLGDNFVFVKKENPTNMNILKN